MTNYQQKATVDSKLNPSLAWLNSVFQSVCTIAGNSNYPRHGHGISRHTAVTEVRGQVTLHGAWDSSSLPLLPTHQLLHPEVPQKQTNRLISEKHWESGKQLR